MSDSITACAAGQACALGQRKCCSCSYSCVLGQRRCQGSRDYVRVPLGARSRSATGSPRRLIYWAMSLACGDGLASAKDGRPGGVAAPPPRVLRFT